MKDKIIEILESTLPGVDFAVEQNLIDDEIIGSLDMVAIVTQLISEFGVELSVDDLLPENFNSADAIVRLVESKQ
jgi:D-alanine--poly(phosphoribitol) ligase subunit 2